MGMRTGYRKPKSGETSPPVRDSVKILAALRVVAVLVLASNPAPASSEFPLKRMQLLLPFATRRKG